MGDIKDISEEDKDMLTEDVQSHFKTPYCLKEFKSVGLGTVHKRSHHFLLNNFTPLSPSLLKFIFTEKAK